MKKGKKVLKIGEEGQRKKWRQGENVGQLLEAFSWQPRPFRFILLLPSFGVKKEKEKWLCVDFFG